VQRHNAKDVWLIAPNRPHVLLLKEHPPFALPLFLLGLFLELLELLLFFKVVCVIDLILDFKHPYLVVLLRLNLLLDNGFVLLLEVFILLYRVAKVAKHFLHHPSSHL
jgi:hypothetical protein